MIRIKLYKENYQIFVGYISYVKDIFYLQFLLFVAFKLN